jgi:hypothetical protein
MPKYVTADPLAAKRRNTVLAGPGLVTRTDSLRKIAAKQFSEVISDDEDTVAGNSGAPSARGEIVKTKPNLSKGHSNVRVILKE